MLFSSKMTLIMIINLHKYYQINTTNYTSINNNVERHLCVNDTVGYLANS